MGALPSLGDTAGGLAGVGPGTSLHVPLDAVVVDHRGARLRSFFAAVDAVLADPWAARDWAFAGQRYLEAHGARAGERVATSDPHALELGAYGVAAFHHTPAPLLAHARSRRVHRAASRRVLVRVNDVVPRDRDPVDVGFHLARLGGPQAFAGAALEVAGEAVEALTLAERRRLLAALAGTGAATALVRIDGGPGADATRHDELVIVNASELGAFATTPEGNVTPVASFGDEPVRRVVAGGCVGGDLETLGLIVERLAVQPPAPGVEVYLVPASERLLDRAAADGWVARAADVGARMVAPQALPLLDGGVLATSSCLAPGAIVASPRTCAASAHWARVRVPGGVA